MLQFLASASSNTCFSLVQSSCLLYALATMVLLIAPFSDAALPCSCSPLTYEWRLDFEAGGCPGNLTEILDQVDGITNNSMCQLDTTTDIAPEHVNELRFYEYGAGLHNLVNFRVQRGKWNNTDTMSVHSITSEDPTIVTSSATIELSGTKGDGSSFLFIWLADYTNACNVEPYDGIESISYLNFVSFFRFFNCYFSLPFRHSILTWSFAFQLKLSDKFEDEPQSFYLLSM